MEGSRYQDLYDILERCCLAAGISVDKARSSARNRPVVAVRQVYAYLAKRDTSYSTAEVGAFIGIARTTVLYSIKTAHNLIDVGDKLVCSLLKQLQ
jgi:chromosomal replication initiation ATPase DnaA